MQIYLARNNQQAGPYSLEQLNQMLSSQQVLLTDLVWHEGMSEWKTLGELTQGKLVYEPIGYSPFNSQIKSEQNSTTFTIKVEQKTTELASFHSRLLAKILDLILWLPASYLLTAFFSPEQQKRLLEINTQFYQLLSKNTSDIQLVQQLQNEMFSLISIQAWILAGIYIVIMLAIQAFLISKLGQSIGKKIVGIKIVDADTNGKVGLVRSFWLRSIIFVIPNIIPMFKFGIIISIFDTLFAFNKNRQTLHDKLAKTKVVKQ